jgi:pimeloyl-ACP methyl ester carboxylesterase
MELRISGRRLVCDVYGTGPTCVLLHAFPFDRRLLAATATRLAARARVLVPDLRGFGDSELDGPYSIADLADDVARLLDEQGVERAVVGGISMGGYVSLAFASLHPQRLLGLVLADTKAGPDSSEARAARDQAMALVREEGVAAFVEAQLPKLLGPSASAEMREQVRALGAQRAESVLAALTALRDRPDRRPDLGRITCPTLILVGADDVVTPPAEAAALTTAISRAVLVEIPGAGHLANLEAPLPFAQAIAGFLGRTQAAS